MSGRKKILRTMIVILGILGVIWFCIPLVKHKILNIGNATGIVVFLCMVIYGMKMPLIHQWLIRIWDNRAGKVVLGVAALLVLTVSTLTVVFSVCMFKAAGQNPKENPTVVVLGCRVYGEQASLMLRERLEAAYAYLTEHEDAVCILSGGQGNGEDISEAECMYRYLTEKGISKNRLYKEDKSTSTRENLEFSLEIITEEQLNKEIAIVTNEFHEYRAAQIAKALGLEVSAVPAKTAWWLFPTYYVRELYGIVYEAVL